MAAVEEAQDLESRREAGRRGRLPSQRQIAHSERANAQISRIHRVPEQADRDLGPAHAWIVQRRAHLTSGLPPQCVSPEALEQNANCPPGGRFRRSRLAAAELPDVRSPSTNVSP